MDSDKKLGLAQLRHYLGLLKLDLELFYEALKDPAFSAAIANAVMRYKREKEKKKKEEEKRNPVA